MQDIITFISSMILEGYFGLFIICFIINRTEGEESDKLQDILEDEIFGDDDSSTE